MKKSSENDNAQPAGTYTETVLKITDPKTGEVFVFRDTPETVISHTLYQFSRLKSLLTWLWLADEEKMSDLSETVIQALPDTAGLIIDLLGDLEKSLTELDDSIKAREPGPLRNQSREQRQPSL